MFYRPINLIHETKDRWVYAIAFGALTGQFLYLILDGNILASAGPIGNIWRGTGLKLNVILILHYDKFFIRFNIGIVLILLMMIYPLVYFALFASIHGTIQIVSQVIGFVYVSLA